MEELDHIRINEFTRTGKCGFQALPLCADQWLYHSYLLVPSDGYKNPG